MRSAAKGQVDLPLAQAYDAHRRCIEAFTDVAHTTFWARWIYLERACELASRTGDLLHGALLLRTMIEDVWAVRALSSLEADLDLKAGAPHQRDLLRIRAHGDLLWSRFLPPIKEFPQLPEAHAPNAFDGPEYQPLQNAFQQLNDYVHPNYGSQLLALFPERTRALEALLDAYIVVYDEFFKVPWADELLEVPLSLLPPLAIRNWGDEALFLQERILPEIQSHRAERKIASHQEDPAPHLRRRLEGTDDAGLEAYWRSIPEWFESLRPLAEFVLRKKANDQELCSGLMTFTAIGTPMRPFEIKLFADARGLACNVEQEFPNGRPAPEHFPLDWFRFCQTATELALVTTQHKMNLMSWALVRQLNDHNPVASILALRSLVEHYAVVIYLGNRLDAAWDEIAKRGSSGTLPINQLVKFEENIARFLAGTKGTVEELSSWKTEWATLDLDRAINLRSATEQGLEQDILGYLYDFGSDVIHGRKARGIELCPPTEGVYLRANLSRALLGLDILSSIERTLDIIAKPISTLRKMNALRKALSMPGADWPKIIRTALAPKDRSLKPGRDYAGHGTLEDPFSFAHGIDYFDGFSLLCKQFDLRSDERRLVCTADKRYLDAVPDNHGKLHYFRTLIGAGFNADGE